MARQTPVPASPSAAQESRIKGQGKGLGSGPAAVMASSGLHLLTRMVDALEKLVYESERETDYDVTYVVGGVNAAAAVFTIQIPRTIHHMELTLEVDSSTAVSVAVLPGQVALADAQNRHRAVGGAGPSPSQAICSSSGSGVTVRDYSDQSGYLTVLFTAAATTFANVRIRSLDRLSSRQQRT